MNFVIWYIIIVWLNKLLIFKIDGTCLYYYLSIITNYQLDKKLQIIAFKQHLVQMKLTIVVL